MTISKSFLKVFRFHLLILSLSRENNIFSPKNYIKYMHCVIPTYFSGKKDTVFYLVITTFKSHENEKLSRTHTF